MKEIALYTLDIAQNSITAQARRLDITLTEEGKTITLSIRDDGTGMAPELLARVEGLLRHTGRRAATLQAFDAVIDPDNHIVTQNGTRVELTPREFDLLLALVRARGQLLYREALYERVWGLDSNAGPRTVDIHIHRLRKKLHWDHKIVTVPKVGYKLLP